MTAGPAEPTAVKRTIAPLPSARDAEAAALLASCAGGSVEAGAALLAGLRAHDGAELLGLEVDGALLGLAALQPAGLTMELKLLLVAAEARRQGHGKELMTAALVRAGRRPTVTEVDEAALPFYQAMRFRLVGKRRQADGSFRYRLGWHPPGPDPRHRHDH